MKLSHAIVGILASIVLAFAGGSAFEGQRRDALQASDGEQEQKMLTLMNQRSAALLDRANSCEAKFTVGTVMFEPRALASESFFGGAVSLDVGNGAQLAGAWYVPVQVEAHSTIPGAQYRWIDGKTGEIKGVFPALPAGNRQ